MKMNKRKPVLSLTLLALATIWSVGCGRYEDAVDQKEDAQERRDEAATSLSKKQWREQDLASLINTAGVTEDMLWIIHPGVNCEELGLKLPTKEQEALLKMPTVCVKTLDRRS